MGAGVAACVARSPADGWDFPQGLGSGQNGMYTAEMRFENRLLRDWTVRTLDPFEANMFYLPSRNYGWTSNGGDPNVRTMSPRPHRHGHIASPPPACLTG